MGIFKRAADMVKASANKALDNLEDTEAMIDQAIRDKEEALNEAKSASATVFGNLKQLEKNIVETKSKIADWEERIKLSIQKGNDELAKKAISGKAEEEKSLQSLEKSYETAKLQTDTLKANLNELQRDLDKLIADRDNLVARLKAAEASEKTNEILANVTSKNNTVDLDRLERKIEAKEARAAGLAEMKTTSLEDEFDKLSETTAEDELAKYKELYGKK